MDQQQNSEGIQNSEVSSNSAENNDVRMVPESELHATIGAVKKKYLQKGKEMGKNEAYEELQSQNVGDNVQSQPPHNNNVSNNAGGQSEIPEQWRSQLKDEFRKEYEEAERKRAEEYQRYQDQQWQEQVANQVRSNAEKARESYPDFDDLVKRNDLAAFGNAVTLANDLPNAHDVLYELAKNPLKASSIENLVYNSPVAAKNELEKLSKSIVKNKEAQEQENSQKIPEPLDRLSSSYSSTGGSGSMSISELRKMPIFRG